MNKKKNLFYYPSRKGHKVLLRILQTTVDLGPQVRKLYYPEERNIVALHLLGKNRKERCFKNAKMIGPHFKLRNLASR